MWPIWILIRSAGLTAYLLLFLSVLFGLLGSMQGCPVKWRPVLQIAHQTAGWLAFLIGLLHGMLLHFDTYQPFRWTEIFIPFAASYKKVPSALGTVTGGLLFIVLVTTDMRKRLSRKLWKVLHLLSLPACLLGGLHGIWIGTDTGKPLILAFYASTLSILFVLLVLRFMANQPAKKTRKV
ncbi:ferric reductase-like transmembrane domain-containing protein [Ectobacillus ponti]|uniref:Ferric reductase-like transmembrane domain-containing protein n=1 Tax=Ectobacillus ponti TaxID=2961894 RepID=A0AA41X9R4_9BACI|nr:ferric reductase-like transmembrane domain-containing protein [Ectobacillus ponti]MCP8971302.1 ferric reductase-like transmembrane domain-containing protein [Ectobacillus ponti]